MLLGLKRERVDVDANRRHVGVVLVRLDQVEVATLTLVKAVVAVELDLGRHDGVAARHALHARHGVARLEDRAVKPVRVVERLLALVHIHARVAGNIAVTLDNPHELLRGVVEVELDLVRRGGDRLTARELELLDQVLVGDLGEAAALIRVEVDVVDVERGRDEAGRRNAATDRLGRRAVPAEVLERVELEPDLHLVVLERNQRERKTRVAVEPELERHVQRVLRGAVRRDRRRKRLRVGRAGAVAALAALDEQVDELGHVADHVGVTGLLAGLLRELIPDLEPVTVVLVNLLATDLNVHIVDQVVADPVEPAELRTRTVERGIELDLGERGLEVDAVDQIAVTADRALDLLAEVRRAVERLFNGLHGEVCVATVDDLKKSDLRVARQVNILRTISDELHKATGSHVLYPAKRKKFRQLRERFHAPNSF